MLSTTVTYTGRIVGVRPAVLAPLLEEAATVPRMVNQPASPENNWTMTRIESSRELFWYTDHVDGDRVFCTLSGLGPKIIRMLQSRGVEVTVVDRTVYKAAQPDLNVLRGVEWRPRQTEVLSHIFGRRHGTIVCPMAFGKTFLIKQIARAFNTTRIVVTAPGIDICNNIYRDLHGHIDDVGMIGGGKRMLERRVTVVVSQSLQYAYKNAGLVLADECHSLATDRYAELFAMFNNAKLFGFTATPEGRSDRSDGLIEAIFGPELMRVTYQEAVGQGSVVQLHVEMYDTQGPWLGGVTNKVRVDDQGLWSNQRRNELIAKIARKKMQELGPDAQILIMVDKTKHAYLLQQLLPEYTVVTGQVDAVKEAKFRADRTMLPDQKVCSIADRKQALIDFESNRLKYAIATKVWRQGVDFRDLACLIRADGLASPIDSGQVPGRLSRLGRETDKSHGVLIDFNDTFTPQLAARARARLTAYRENGWFIEQHQV